jgi:hypothetical protein
MIFDRASHYTLVGPQHRHAHPLLMVHKDAPQIPLTGSAPAAACSMAFVCTMEGFDSMSSWKLLLVGVRCTTPTRTVASICTRI